MDKINLIQTFETIIINVQKQKVPHSALPCLKNKIIRLDGEMKKNKAMEGRKHKKSQNLSQTHIYK